MTATGVAPQPSFPITRKWLRHKLDVEVLIATQSPTRVMTSIGRGSALNEGGLAVDAKIDLGIAEQVLIRFTPPGSSESMGFRCFVRNRQGSRYGLEFITENDSDYLNTGRLQELLAKKLQTESQ